MDLSTIFAWTVTILAAVAVVGALAYAIVWEVAAIRRVLDRSRPDRRPLDDGDFWHQQRALNEPR
jgi:hypothetical protein